MTDTYDRAAADAEADAWAGPLPNPDDFFDGKAGLMVSSLADSVAARVPLARMNLHGTSDAHDPLWTYRAGVWVPGGEKAASVMAVQLLENRHRRNHLNNCIDVLRTMPMDNLTPGAPHPDLLNVRNGMLDWRTSELVDHDPKFLSTVQLPVAWNPAATCPTVDEWLHEVLPDEGMVAFAWEVIGYLLMNGNPLHRAFLLVGAGRNGKSTFLRLVEWLLGQANCSSVPLQKLGDGHRFAAAEMFMKSANICGDLAATHLKDTSTFKQVTGGDPVFAERKMRDPFQFIYWGVPIFSANAIPGAEDTSHGFLSRWEIIRFPVDLTGRTDPTIEGRLRAELPGVLVRAVAGLRTLMDRGDFDRPAAVVEARDEFARHIDQVRGFLKDSTQPGGWTPRAELYEEYQRWAARNGHGELGSRKFNDRVRAAGIGERKVNGARGFNVELARAPRADRAGPTPHAAHARGNMGLPALSAPTAPAEPDEFSDEALFGGQHCTRCDRAMAGTMGGLCAECMAPSCP